MKTPLYIFDLDGTLALIEHRRHFVEGPRKDRDWNAFHQACIHDIPNIPVIGTLMALRASGCDVWIYSGRSDEVMTETINWLYEYVGANLFDLIRMRPRGNFTLDDKLKKQWLDEMYPEDRERLVAVFEDRDRMVKMWRENGVACFQVAPGDF